MEDTPAATADQCWAGWLEPVDGGAAGHSYAQVMHRCKKPILHAGDHGCADCGRIWPKF